MWDLKYRPLRYSDVLGQEGNVQLLKARLKNGTAFDTSYIFAGGFGRGKTTLSRIHARAMLCLDLDKQSMEPCNVCDNCRTILQEQPGPFTERDAASLGTIDHMRAIVEELPYVLVDAPKRIYLFDEAHRMSVASQDVLLKPIEDKKMVGMFCTTEAEKIRGAIRSRCEEYTIRKITREDILKRMRHILDTEGVEYEDEGVLIVIDHSGGHVRDVINKLEMISQLGPVSVSNVREYLHLSVITLYFRILLNLDNPVLALELVDQACDQTSPDEVASGLAEAAMNCFRLANGMHADSAFVDKNLAAQVSAKYQAHVIRLVNWFLGSKYTSKLSLTRDIVLLSQNPGNLPSDGPQPPVVIVSQTTYAAPQPGTQPALPLPVIPATTTPVRPTPTVSVPKSAEKPGHRPYTELVDRTEPTPTEAAVMKKTFPRTRGTKNEFVARSNRSGTKDLTPYDWRLSFERLLARKRGPALPT